jgi:hypothetical protein
MEMSYGTLADAGINEKALVAIDKKIEKKNEQLASAQRANRGLHRSMRELKIEDEVRALQVERSTICGGRMVFEAKGTYRVYGI